MWWKDITLRIDISFCLMLDSFPAMVLRRICFTATGAPVYSSSRGQCMIKYTVTYQSNINTAKVVNTISLNKYRLFFQSSWPFCVSLRTPKQKLRVLSSRQDRTQIRPQSALLSIVYIILPRGETSQVLASTHSVAFALSTDRTPAGLRDL